MHCYEKRAPRRDAATHRISGVIAGWGSSVWSSPIIGKHSRMSAVIAFVARASPAEEPMDMLGGCKRVIRRRAMRLDAGEIEPSLIVVGAPESVPEVEPHNCVVITGVPRAGRDDAYSEKLARGPKIEPPDERYRSYAPEEAPPPPRPQPTPEPSASSTLYRVSATIRRPDPGRNDPGEIVQGSCRLAKIESASADESSKPSSSEQRVDERRNGRALGQHDESAE
jgi:hypothetical protein